MSTTPLLYKCHGQVEMVNICQQNLWAGTKEKKEDIVHISSVCGDLLPPGTISKSNQDRIYESM